jgi:hypothetical protein
MAKVSGLTTTATIASNNISNDITSITLSTPWGVQDVTGLDKSGFERLLLRGDVSGTITGVFNATASQSHATLKTPGSKTFVLYFAQAVTATFTAVTTSYDITMGADGSLTWSAPFSLSSGTPCAWT